MTGSNRAANQNMKEKQAATKGSSNGVSLGRGLHQEWPDKEQRKLGCIAEEWDPDPLPFAKNMCLRPRAWSPLLAAQSLSQPAAWLDFTRHRHSDGPP